MSLGRLPTVSERLDFAEKKKALGLDEGAARARMLSSFHYDKFDTALASALRRNGVFHWQVNPAYMCLIGRVKFARRYGSSVHASAAIVIARRAMRYSERLPRSSDGTVKVPLRAGATVTLGVPARNDRRHVWSSWRVLGKGVKAALAAQGRAGRKVRSPVGVLYPSG